MRMAGRMLSFKDRQRVRELELRHGVIVKVEDDGSFTANRWTNGTDIQVADADSLTELEVVLQASYVFPDDEE